MGNTKRRGKAVIQALNNRIEWVRMQLDKGLEPEQSIDMQWLLNHLITIQEGKNIYHFTLDPNDLTSQEKNN